MRINHVDRETLKALPAIDAHLTLRGLTLSNAFQDAYSAAWSI